MNLLAHKQPSLGLSRKDQVVFANVLSVDYQAKSCR